MPILPEMYLWTRKFLLRDGHFIVNRIVNVWNSLPDCIVMSNSVVAFRQKLKQLHFPDFCNT